MTETKVYTASVDCLEDPVLYQRALDILPATRRESAERMKPAGGKRLSAGAGVLLLASLENCLPGRLPDLRSLRFELGEYGKPYLPDYPQVHFNLSHSGSRVMCIVSPFECGCDVEQLDRRQEQIEMVIRCLAESEQRLAKVSAQNFYRIWTLKESILKLSGKGLAIPFDSFEVSLDPPAVRQDFLREPVILKEYDTFRTGHGTEPDGQQYCCAVAMAEGNPPDAMIQIDLREAVAQIMQQEASRGRV